MIGYVTNLDYSIVIGGLFVVKLSCFYQDVNIFSQGGYHI